MHGSPPRAWQLAQPAGHSTSSHSSARSSLLQVSRCASRTRARVKREGKVPALPSRQTTRRKAEAGNACANCQIETGACTGSRRHGLEAVELYQRMLNRNPEAEEALVNLISLAIAQDDDAGTQQWSERPQQLRPSSQTALEGLSACAFASGDYKAAKAYDGARGYWRQALDAKPELAEGYFGASRNQRSDPGAEYTGSFIPFPPALFPAPLGLLSRPRSRLQRGASQSFRQGAAGELRVVVGLAKATVSVNDSDKDNKPLEGVPIAIFSTEKQGYIQFESRAVLSDSDGAVTFEGIPPGSYAVVLTNQSASAVGACFGPASPGV